MESDDFGNLSALPEQVREIYMWLCQDVGALNQKWDFYEGMFGNRDNFELLDLASPAIRLIEESLRNDIIMSIGRLGDPLKTCNRENLNFATLENFYATDDVLKVLLKKFRDSCALLRLHRNKFIGHSDLNARMKPEDFPILKLGKADVDSAIETAEAILKHVAIRYGGTEIGIGRGMFKTTTSESLLYWLRKGWDHRLDRLLGTES
jgi:hypothetical protein